MARKIKISATRNEPGECFITAALTDICWYRGSNTVRRGVVDELLDNAVQLLYDAFTCRWARSFAAVERKFVWSTARR